MRVAKLLVALRLAVSFAWALVRANLAVAKVVLSPRLGIRPGLVRFPTELTGDAAVTLLANMITLTPGTLTLAVSDDRDCLYVHALDIGDPENVVAEIRRDLEQYVAALER